MNKDFIDDDMCFVCGKNNPIGLKTHFHIDGENLFMSFNLDKNYQGWGEVLHGGFQSMLLDEVQVQIAGYKGYKTVTAEINVRFKKPVMTGKNYKAVAKIEKINPKLIETSAYIIDDSKNIYATSTAKLRVLGSWTGNLKIDD